jgi:hypothetical protein
MIAILGLLIMALGLAVVIAGLIQFTSLFGEGETQDPAPHPVDKSNGGVSPEGANGHAK